MAALAIVALGGVALLWVFWPDPRMREAKNDILKIEIFQKEHHRLPNSFSEIGVEEDESGPVFYKKQSDESYILWIGLSLGESNVYDSQSRRWSGE